MPGLCGIASVRPDGLGVRTEVYRAMLATLKHRPDYDVSEYSDNGKIILGVIGHKELIGRPRQSGRTLLAYYGQHIAPVRTDELNDRNPAAELKPTGNFSLVKYTASSETLTLLVDRYASEPIFYSQIDGVLYFAPEIKALLAVPQLEREIDYEALACFLGSGHFLGDQTLLANVRKLPGGHELRVAPNGIRISSYWRFEPGQRHGQEDRDFLSHTLAELIESSMTRRFHRRDDELIFLSGGLDSRAILAGALTTTPSSMPIQTVSWGVEINTEGTDQNIAASIADYFGLRHRFMPRRTEAYGDNVEETLHLIDAQCDVPCMHASEYQLLASLEQEGIRTVFRGDQVFGRRAKVYSHLGALSNVGIRRFSSLPHLSNLLLPEVYEICRSAGDHAFDALYRDCQELEPNDAKDMLFFSHRLQNYLGPASYYKRVLFRQVDPLLCDEILDFMSFVPRNLRCDKVVLHAALKKMNPDLARIPFATVAGLEKWAQELAITGPVRKYVETQVEDSISPVWDIFDQKATGALLEEAKKSPRAHPPVAIWHGTRERVKRALYGALPKSAAELHARRAQAYLPIDVLLMRFIALKHSLDVLLKRS